MKIASIALAALALGLTACGGSAPPPPKAAEAAQPAQPLPNSNIFSADVKALNKAKAVQGIMDKQKAATDKQIQASGG
jgi:hypothetical protein